MIISSPCGEERDDHERFILFLSHANTGPRATGVGVLQHGSCQSRAGLDTRLAKDQLPETNPKGGGQAHPSKRGHRYSNKAMNLLGGGPRTRSIAAFRCPRPVRIRLLFTCSRTGDTTEAIPQTLLSSEWWSLSGSNRRPPACKAGALPAELKPLFEDQTRNPGRDPGSHTPLPHEEAWWARVDSNYRPHPYQGAL